MVRSNRGCRCAGTPDDGAVIAMVSPETNLDGKRIFMGYFLINTLRTYPRNTKPYNAAKEIDDV